MKNILHHAKSDAMSILPFVWEGTQISRKWKKKQRIKQNVKLVHFKLHIFSLCYHCNTFLFPPKPVPRTLCKVVMTCKLHPPRTWAFLSCHVHLSQSFYVLMESFLCKAHRTLLAVLKTTHTSAHIRVRIGQPILLELKMFIHDWERHLFSVSEQSFGRCFVKVNIDTGSNTIDYLDALSQALVHLLLIHNRGQKLF